MSRPTYEEWCKEFKFGSMSKKPDLRRQYQPGEFDYDKFIKRINNIGREPKQQTSIVSENLKKIRMFVKHIFRQVNMQYEKNNQISRDKNI